MNSEMTATDAFIWIGEYQLRNLQMNRVKFLFLDLRDPIHASSDHDGLLRGSLTVADGNVLPVVQAAQTAPDGAIVLICEDGKKSSLAAIHLAQAKYINVFVVEGGTGALDAGF